MAAQALNAELIAEVHRCRDEGLNKSETAEQLSISRNSVSKYWQGAGSNAARSTLYGSDGKVVAQWVKETPKEDAFESTAKAYVEALCSAVKPLKKTRAPKALNRDRMACYLIGDAHIGMLAWGEETGDNFDTKIALRDLCAATDILTDDCPPTDECVILNLGDWYHMDDRLNVTPGHKHPLDVDGRYLQVMRVGIQAMRYMIDRALRKHRVVRVRNVAGNHDPHSSITLTLAMSALYDKEPRVVIEDSPKSFWPFVFGKCLVGVHHGDQLKKPQMQAMTLAQSQSVHWSNCTFRYVWHGHIHHIHAEEHMGVVVESFRTLAGRDAYHAAHGYNSGREMKAIILDRNHGEVARHTAAISRVMAS